MNASAGSEGLDLQRTTPRGRKSAGGQESVIRPDVLEKKVADLVGLLKKANSAAEVYAEAVKATAEKCGMLSTVVRKYVAARAGDDAKFQDKKAEIGQLALAFNVDATTAAKKPGEGDD